MSTFYNTGTITVTNASTTATLSVAVPAVVDVRAGDLLTVSTGLAVIASLNPARTQLTLARAWAGSTASGANFEIILLADSVRTANLTSTLLADLRSGPVNGRFAAGTAGAPGVSSGAHQTSGLFWASGVLGGAVNGTERMRLTTTGAEVTGTLLASTSLTTPLITRAGTIALAATGANIITASTNGTERMRIASNGNVGIGTTSPGSALQVQGLITGTAVTQSNTDTTAGRLLKTGAGPAQAFRRGNILGTVSQSGGVPTGAIIERGSNANGEFVRFADGTQMCWRKATLPDIDTWGTTTDANFALPVTMTGVVAGAIVSDNISGTGNQARNRRVHVTNVEVTASQWLTRAASGVQDMHGTGHATANVDVTLLAVGRWF
jgi:hypothetical protein